MQMVVETPTFQKAAQRAGLTAIEVEAIVDYLARNPEAGDLIKGSGGCRKVRIAGRGKGKSGGHRVISFYTGEEIPVFLLTIYSKGSLGNLSAAQVNALKLLTKQLIDTYDTT